MEMEHCWTKLLAVKKCGCELPIFQFLSFSVSIGKVNADIIIFL